MSWIVSIGIGILVLPSLLVVLLPLIDQVFNVSFLSYFTNVISFLNVMIGSYNTNIFLIVLSFIMFLMVFRWILRVIGLVK